MIYISITDPFTKTPLCFKCEDLWVTKTEFRDNPQDEALPDSEREITRTEYELMARGPVCGTYLPLSLMTDDKPDAIMKLYDNIICAANQNWKVYSIGVVEK